MRFRFSQSSGLQLNDLINGLTIVKLGGSVITYKNKSPPEVNNDAIKRIVHELSVYRGTLIIVLGGGAHGHQAAKEYGFDNKTTSPERLISGIPLIRLNMTALSSAICGALLENGIPAVVIPPFCFVKMAGGVVFSYSLDLIKQALSARLVVVTHGDVCFDSQRGAAILSGDRLVILLANELFADCVLVGTDVDGVFDDDPRSNPNARLIPVIYDDIMSSHSLHAGPSKSVDVTGGMSTKIEELLHLKNTQTFAAIFNLTVPGRLKQLLVGETGVCCTRVLPCGSDG